MKTEIQVAVFHNFSHFKYIATSVWRTVSRSALVPLLQACYKRIRLPLRARTKNISEYCCKPGTSALRRTIQGQFNNTIS